jgi:HEAT repeat protein
MRRSEKVLVNRAFRCVTILCLAGAALWPFRMQAANESAAGTEKAWDMLDTAAASRKTGERADSIRALGLLPNDVHARNLARHALEDPKLEVRVAAATALGQMRCTESIPWLRKLLSDKKLPVVMAAAHSLRELKDDSSAYAIYFDLLTGTRKSNDGLIAQQLETLHNPKELAKIGFSEGIGFVPFAGIGWEAYRTMHKKDPNPARAVAARILAHDPDPATAAALVKATHDKNWIVRAAALEAIAEREDPSLQPKVEPGFADRNALVRFTAAAAVIRLSSVADGHKEKEQGADSSDAGHASGK